MSKSVVFLLSTLFLFIGLKQVDLIASDGKTIYEANCKSCHGPDGKGNPKLANSMGTAKLDLTDKETSEKKDAELGKTVADGAGKMKPFKDKIKDEEIYAVIKYLRSLKK